MANNVNTQLQENPRLQRMPTDQREWHFFVNELAKWVADLDVRGRLTTDRIIPQVILSNAGSVQESLPIVATDAGASVTANISSHTLARQTGDVTYNAGTITGLDYDTTYYVYADDADYQGGSVTYLATEDKGDVVGSMGRYFIGEIITPASGEPDRTGSPGAGAGVFNIDIFRTGIKATNTDDGIIRTSTSATVNTGTATDEAITPEALANSDFIMLNDLYGITAEETGEGLVEANLNLQYPPGNVLRYGTNTTPGTTDMTDAIQTAIDVVYAQANGGDVIIPEGVYGVTSVSQEWVGASGADVTTINVRGAGTLATQLHKLGATTTPVIDFFADNIQTPRSVLEDFSIWGNSEQHPGIRLTLLARMVLQRIAIYDCSDGLSNRGTQFMSVYDCTLTSNDRGYHVEEWDDTSPTNIQPNSIQFFGGEIRSNTDWGAEIEHGDLHIFHGTNFERNGTASTSTTGAVMVRDTIDDRTTWPTVELSGCHFEENNGGNVIQAEASNLTLSLRNIHMFGTSSDANAISIAAIKLLHLENYSAYGTGAAVTSAATSTLISGGRLGTYTDNSTTTYLEGGSTYTRSISATGAIEDIGQVGTFAFLSAASGLANVGAYNYDTASTEPLRLFCTHAQLPTYTDTQLNDITDAVNTDTGKIQGAMVYNSTQDAPVYAIGGADGAVWVDGAGTTVNTPV